MNNSKKDEMLKEYFNILSSDQSHDSKMMERRTDILGALKFVLMGMSSSQKACKHVMKIHNANKNSHFNTVASDFNLVFKRNAKIAHMLNHIYEVIKHLDATSHKATLDMLSTIHIYPEIKSIREFVLEIDPWRMCPYATDCDKLYQIAINTIRKFA